jgi:hypothetical protein
MYEGPHVESGEPGAYAGEAVLALNAVEAGEPYSIKFCSRLFLGFWLGNSARSRSQALPIVRGASLQSTISSPQGLTSPKGSKR